MPLLNLRLIIRKTRQDLLKNKLNRILLAMILLFALLSIGVAFSKYSSNYESTEKYRKETRENWEKRPDKHPHRMAHYGYLVFRNAYPLQIFDGGLDNYLGNVIFLEAHKQNTANLSEAGSSGILVRFGTFSCAFILQTIVPIIILFLGFGLIAKEREDATLKLLNIQGLSGRTIIWGKVIGIWQFSLLFFLPLIPIVFIASAFSGNASCGDLLFRLTALCVSYITFYFFVCTLTVIVSARSKTATTALVTLIGYWLLMVLIVPKAVQFFAQNTYPTPSRIALETEVEEDVLKVGNSHNPDDPHFKHIKDSLLAHYNVKTMDELPVNFGGIVMKEGEKITTKIYTDHLNELDGKYNKQQRLNEISGFINPVAAIKDFSMTVSGTDNYAYQKFQQQAEQYRYQLSQHMNDLQIEHISNKKSSDEEHPAVVSKDNWKEFPDFK